MATKTWNEQTFNLGNGICVYCSSADTRNGFKHTAEMWDKNYNKVSVKICYLNRTWEEYDYQSVLAKLFNKLGKEYAVIFNLWDIAHKESEKEKWDGVYNEFLNEYEKLSPKNKERIAKIGVCTCIEQVNGLIQIAKQLNALNCK